MGLWINEIRMNDNREIFEVPGVYENPRRQTLTLALTVYVKCLKYVKLVEFDTQICNLPTNNMLWSTSLLAAKP
jgi:hypothetical protein